MTGAEIVFKVLEDQNVRHIFGYPGGAVLPIYDELKNHKKIKHILVRHEQGAGHAAEGYARSSGKPGVMLVTSGPGATNAVTALTDAYMDSIPLVCITGQVPTHLIGTDAFQEAPVRGVMSSVAKHVYLVTDPKKLESTMRTAFELARTGRPGPVVVDVPKDVQNWEGAYQGKGRLPILGYRYRLEAVNSNTLSKQKCKEFFSMLAEAKRPLIYAGGGVINGNASDALRKLALTFKIPVTTTLMGLGGFDTKHPLSLHMLGMHGTAYANYAVDDCDLLINVGARFDDRVAGDPKRFAANAQHILHFDLDPSEINKVKSTDWYHLGILREALKTLVNYGQKIHFNPDYSPWHEEIGKLKSTYALNYDRESKLIQPNYVIETINKITKGKAIITTGVGQHQMWAAQYCDFRDPRLWLTSGSR